MEHKMNTVELDLWAGVLDGWKWIFCVDLKIVRSLNLSCESMSMFGDILIH